jgi:hypothetical protein
MNVRDFGLKQIQLKKHLRNAATLPAPSSDVESNVGKSMQKMVLYQCQVKIISKIGCLLLIFSVECLYFIKNLNYV